MTVAILVPVLNRPHNVEPLLESIRESTTVDHQVLFVADPDDEPERHALDRAGAVTLLKAGTYAEKINHAAGCTSASFVFLAADDLRFHRGWFENAVARMTGRVGVVGTNDLGNRRVIAGEHSTHSLVARWYIDQGTIDEPGKVLHEGYTHCFCDDELVATAKHRGAWAFAPDSIVEHLHPDWAKGQRDSTYDLGQRNFRHDRRVFHRRRHLWT